MELELDLGQEYSPNQTLKVSPRLVAANYILELSSQELQQQIATELSENPALELVETPTCRVCGTELQGSICPRCIQRQKSSSTSAYGPESRAYGYDDGPDGRNRSPDDEDFDPLLRHEPRDAHRHGAAEGQGGLIPQGCARPRRGEAGAAAGARQDLTAARVRRPG